MWLRMFKLTLLAVVGAASLLLLIAVSLLWARSHLQTDDITWHTTGRMTRFRTSGGGFWFETRPWPLATPSAAPPRTEWHRFTDRADYPFAASESSPLLERCGFLVNTQSYDLLLVAPYWFFAALLLPLPLGCATAACRGQKPAALNSNPE